MKVWQGYHRGIDLGGWFSQCDYTEDRYNNFITEPDFAVIAGWGLDHVRLPYDYDLLEDADGNRRESGYERLQNAIDWSRKYGLNLILDLHKTFGFSFDVDEGESGFFENEAYQERFYALWESVARRFGCYEDTVAFELLNEVTDKEFCEAWNRISTECIRRIRAICPTIRILVGGYYNNSVEAVKDLAMPYDENIVYNFHCYEPIVFTHQGAGWVPGMDLDFREPIDASYAKIKADTKAQAPTASMDLSIWPDEECLSSKFFESIFEEAVRVAEERNVPLYCGEYGVIDRADPQDTVEWYKMITQAFEKYGIGRACWTYREMDFGVADARMDGVRDELLKYL